MNRYPNATLRFTDANRHVNIPLEGVETVVLDISVPRQTPTQGKRAKHVAKSALRALVRRKVREVLGASEHLALDNTRDRTQLERQLVEALTK